MITTEEKITGVKNIITRSKHLNFPSIVDSGKKCLKKLQEQLKQEVYFKKLADDGHGIEMHNAVFTLETESHQWHVALAKDNPHFPPYLYNDEPSCGFAMCIGGFGKRVMAWGSNDILLITKINNVPVRFKKLRTVSERCDVYMCKLTDAEIKRAIVCDF